MKDNVWGKKERNQRHPALTLQNKSKQEDWILTTDFGVLWTARILFPIENFMHLTSPLSSILWRNNITCWAVTDAFKLLTSHQVPEGNTAFVIWALHHDTCGSPWTHRKHLQAKQNVFILLLCIYILKKFEKLLDTSSDVNGIKWEKEILQ